MILEGLHEKEIFTEDFTFRIALNNEVNYNYPSHWHRAVELIYSVKDSSSVMVNNIEYILSKRDIVIVSPGDIHSFKVKDDIGLMFFIQFDFTKLYGVNVTDDSKAYRFNTEIISVREQKKLHGKLEGQILQMIDEYNDRAFSYELFINARLLDIAVILSRNISSGNHKGENLNKNYTLAKLDKAFEYIEENYKNQITLNDIAVSVGFSKAYFSRSFKKATEKNFHNYLNEYRIRKIESKLFDNNLTITQLAYDAGFNSIVTFNRTFKKIKGCSPTDYLNKRI